MYLLSEMHLRVYNARHIKREAAVIFLGRWRWRFACRSRRQKSQASASFAEFPVLWLCITVQWYSLRCFLISPKTPMAYTVPVGRRVDSFSPEDGDSMFLRDGIYLRVHTALQPRTTSSLSSPPWEPQILYTQGCVRYKIANVLQAVICSFYGWV
jgi:hypothetical protein